MATISPVAAFSEMRPKCARSLCYINFSGTAGLKAYYWQVILVDVSALTGHLFFILEGRGITLFNILSIKVMLGRTGIFANLFCFAWFENL